MVAFRSVSVGVAFIYTNVYLMTGTNKEAAVCHDTHNVNDHDSYSSSMKSNKIQLIYSMAEVT